MKQTLERAKTIVDNGDVKLLRDSNPPSFLHFQVKQRSGKLTDVYRKFNKRTNQYEWSCCALGEKKGKHWSCSFNKSDPTKPRCSHELAAEMYLKVFK